MSRLLKRAARKWGRALLEWGSETTSPLPHNVSFVDFTANSTVGHAHVTYTSHPSRLPR